MSFAQDIKRIVKDAEKSLTKAAANSFKKVYTGIVEDTPSDTGLLKGNWQVSKDSPESGTVSTLGDAKVLSDIESTILEPDVYYLTNNLDYAQYVEYDNDNGDMVRRNTLKFKSIIKEESA